MTSNPFSIAAPHALAADSNVVSSDIIPRDDGGLSGLGGVIIDPRVLGGLASGAKSAPPMAEHVHLFASSNAYGRPWDSKVGIGGRASAAGEGGVTRGDAVAVDSNISTSVNPAGTIGEGSRSSTPVQPLPIDLIQSDFPRTPSPVYTGLAAGSAARRNNDLNSKLFLRSLPNAREAAVPEKPHHQNHAHEPPGHIYEARVGAPLPEYQPELVSPPLAPPMYHGVSQARAAPDLHDLDAVTNYDYRTGRPIVDRGGVVQNTQNYHHQQQALRSQQQKQQQQQQQQYCRHSTQRMYYMPPRHQHPPLEDWHHQQRPHGGPPSLPHGELVHGAARMYRSNGMVGSVVDGDMNTVDGYRRHYGGGVGTHSEGHMAHGNFVPSMAGDGHQRVNASMSGTWGYRYPNRGGLGNSSGGGDGGSNTMRHGGGGGGGGGGRSKGPLVAGGRVGGATLLDEFRSGGGKPQNWSVTMIEGNIVSFCRDQHGSRFLQQQLEVASQDEKELIFSEVLPEALDLMTDVFGNYVMQKLFEHGCADQCDSLLSVLCGNVVKLGFNMYGCRVVQKALKIIDPARLISLVREFEGVVEEAIHDQNGNHCIQKCIEVMSGAPRLDNEGNPMSVHIQFIVDVFRGQGRKLSTHPYGCRVVQRLLEYCGGVQKEEILCEIAEAIDELICDQYGNYIVQHIMIHGREIDRETVMSRVEERLFLYASHKFASNVVEKCLQCGDRNKVSSILDKIVKGEEGPDGKNLMSMIRDQYSNYTVQKAIDLASDSQISQIIEQLRGSISAVRKCTYGKHIIARLEKRTGTRL